MAKTITITPLMRVRERNIAENIWDQMNPNDIPAGRRFKYRATPAECRFHAMTYVLGFDGMDRDREAFRFMADAATSRRVRFTSAQMAAFAEGLRVGLEGVL